MKKQNNNKLQQRQLETRRRQITANALRNERRMMGAEPHPLTVGLHALSPCGAHYMQAMLSPFSLKKAPCIPDLHAIPSKKIKVITRFSFNTGTNGSGYVLYNPQDKCSDPTILSSIVVTDTAYPGNIATTIATAGTGITTLNEPKIPYTANSFENNITQPGIQGRIVGCAIRIRYTGTELNRGGTCTALRHPDNESLIGQTTASLRAYDTASILPITREWHTVVYRPVKPGEFEYSPYPIGDAQSPGVGGNGEQNFTLCFKLDGTSTAAGAGPQAFDVETVKFIEYIGQVDNTSRTHTDLMSLSNVRNSLPEKSTFKNAHKALSKGIQRLGQEALTSLPAHLGSNLITQSKHAESKGFLEQLKDGAISFAGSALKSVVSNGIMGIAKFLL